jgi:hypothetical protein
MTLFPANRRFLPIRSTAVNDCDVRIGVVHCVVLRTQQPPSGYRRKHAIGLTLSLPFAPRQVHSERSVRGPRRAFHRSASVGRDYFAAKI